jgi:hypothetical protein
LSLIETLVELVEEGVFGMPIPSKFRMDISALKGEAFRKVKASGDLLEAEVRKKQAATVTQRVDAEIRLLEAVSSVNRANEPIGRSPFSLVDPPRLKEDAEGLRKDPRFKAAVSELRKAADVIKRKGGTITVNSSELQRRRVAKAVRKGLRPRRSGKR